jgi:DNA polymerase-4
MLRKVEVTRPIRLLGISLSDLTVEEYTPSLLPETRKKEDIQKTLDSINDRFGEFTLAFGESIPDLCRQKVISPSWRAKGIKNSL